MHGLKARPKITSRITSLAHAFVHAIIPRQVDDRHQQWLYQQSGLVAGECAYCGNRATDEDHFRGLVKDGRPSGYFHTADNIIPACGVCNQSKGGSDWRKWMQGSAKGSPTTRQITDLAKRIERLVKFEALSDTKPTSVVSLREMAGEEIWDDYWARLSRIKSDLEAAEIDAALIRERLNVGFQNLKISE